MQWANMEEETDWFADETDGIEFCPDGRDTADVGEWDDSTAALTPIYTICCFYSRYNFYSRHNFNAWVPKEGAWHNVSDLLENRRIDRPFSAE